MFSMFDEVKERSTLKNNKILNLIMDQEPYNEKRLKSLQKAEVYLEPMRGSTMELFCEDI